MIAGDTFDSETHDFSSKLILKRFLDTLDKSGIGAYLICGNHDPLNSYGRNTFNYDENSRIKIIGLNTPRICSMPVYTKSGEQAGILHALSFKEEKFLENPSKYFKRAETGFNIGLLHCDLSGSTDSPYAACRMSELKELNYDYFASGHIHLPSGAENIWYSGTVQGRNTKETGAHGARYIKVSNNNIIENTFIPMDVIRYEDIEADITNAEDAAGALDIIENKITERISGCAEIYLVRPLITGCTACFSEINQEFFNVLSDRIKQDFSERVYISQFECRISPKTDNKTLKEDAGISGEIFRTAENDEILNNAFETVSEKIKNHLAECRFTEEEYKNFKDSVIKQAKEETKNLCSLIYNSSASLAPCGRGLG